jgi:hypothetical protein
MMGLIDGCATNVHCGAADVAATPRAASLRRDLARPDLLADRHGSRSLAMQARIGEAKSLVIEPTILTRFLQDAHTGFSRGHFPPPFGRDCTEMSCDSWAKGLEISAGSHPPFLARMAQESGGSLTRFIRVSLGRHHASRTNREGQVLSELECRDDVLRPVGH